MKKLFSFLFIALFLLSCSTSQNLPYDDVYDRTVYVEKSADTIYYMPSEIEILEDPEPQYEPQINLTLSFGHGYSWFSPYYNWYYPSYNYYYLVYEPYYWYPYWYSSYWYWYSPYWYSPHWYSLYYDYWYYSSWNYNWNYNSNTFYGHRRNLSGSGDLGYTHMSRMHRTPNITNTSERTERTVSIEAQNQPQKYQTQTQKSEPQKYQKPKTYTSPSNRTVKSPSVYESPSIKYGESKRSYIETKTKVGSNYTQPTKTNNYQRNQKSYSTPNYNQKSPSTNQNYQKSYSTPNYNQKSPSTNQNYQKSYSTPNYNQKSYSTPSRSSAPSRSYTPSRR